MNIILKRRLYKELKRYSYSKRKAKQRYKELMAIIYNNEELQHVIEYYTKLNTYYGK